MKKRRNKNSVYLETSFISYLTNRLSRDIVTAGHQVITRDWWETRRDHFELFISEVVRDEVAQGTPEAAAARLAAVEEIQFLDVTNDVISFAESLVSNQIVPAKAATDALHIGLACVNEMDYLLTWNCAHIANAQHYRAIRAHSLEQGYVAPIICTPEELSGEYAHDVKRSNR